MILIIYQMAELVGKTYVSRLLKLSSSSFIEGIATDWKIRLLEGFKIPPELSDEYFTRLAFGQLLN